MSHAANPSSPAGVIKTRSSIEVKTLPEKEHQVIIHCIHTAGADGMYIRIWPTTFLIAKGVQHRSELVLAENIPMAPEWMNVPPGSTVQFSLIFTGLPKSCLFFDLVEEIPEPGAFLFPNIQRNESDVYTIHFS